MLTIIDLFIMFYKLTPKTVDKYACRTFLTYMFLPCAIVLDIIIIKYLFIK
jgi:hypothetical protein